MFARCPAATRAISIARSPPRARAFPAWRDKSFAERAALIKQLSQKLREQQHELAELLTREQGKPLVQSVAEIDRGAAQSDGMVGSRFPSRCSRTTRTSTSSCATAPLGVAGIITPWNAPINLALGPLSPRSTRATLSS